MITAMQALRDAQRRTARNDFVIETLAQITFERRDLGEDVTMADVARELGLLVEPASEPLSPLQQDVAVTMNGPLPRLVIHLDVIP